MPIITSVFLLFSCTCDNPQVRTKKSLKTWCSRQSLQYFQVLYIFQWIIILVQSKQERSICFVHSTNKKTHQGNSCFSSYTYSIISNIWHVVGNKLLKVIRIRHKKNRGLEFLLHIFYATIETYKIFAVNFELKSYQITLGSRLMTIMDFRSPIKSYPLQDQ